MTELAILGPLRKRDLGDQLGTDPMDAPLAGPNADERRIVLSQGMELSTEGPAASRRRIRWPPSAARHSAADIDRPVKRS
jgi:hypothetical protein